MSKVDSFFGSSRAIALIRRHRKEAAEVASLQNQIGLVEVVMPSGSEVDPDNQITVSDVLSGTVKGARLKVAGKVVARTEVAEMFSRIKLAISERITVMEDIGIKLKALGISPK